MNRFCLCLLALSLAACSSEQQERQAAPAPAQEAPTLQRTAAPTDARVFFITPADGTTVSSPVSVEFGMEGMAWQDLEAVLHKLFVFGKGGSLQDLVPSIGFIIEKRMPYMLEMYPDLMGPACFQLAFHKAEVAQAFK